MVKASKIFFRTTGPVALKLGMYHLACSTIILALLLYIYKRSVSSYLKQISHYSLSAQGSDQDLTVLLFKDFFSETTGPISLKFHMWPQGKQRNKVPYFITSSELNAYRKQIKVVLSVYSEKLSYFFTSDEYDFYVVTVANRGCFAHLGLNFFPKRS